MEKNRLKLFRKLSDYFYLLAGTFIGAIGIAVFYTPARITGGGSTGIGAIMYYLFGIDQGIVMMCVNVPLILLGMKVFGFRYGIKTLIGSTLLSIWVSIIGTYTGHMGFLDYSDKVNVLISAIFGGVLLGIGIGLTMRSGCNTGGTDIIAQVISKYTPVSVGSVEFLFNAVVVACGGVFLGLQQMLFAIIAMYISGQVINYVVMSFGKKLSKSMYIFSEESIPDISRRVISELHHGGTIFHGTGIYTAKDRQMLLVIVPNQQVNRLMGIINEEDPKAFVFVTEAYMVLGNGFKPITKALDSN